MTEDTNRIIAEALEPNPKMPKAFGRDKGPLLSAGGMWEYRGPFGADWRPRPFSTNPYTAFDGLLRFAEADPTREVYIYFRSGEHIVYLYDEDGSQFRGAKGNFASAASDALVQWARSKG